MPWFRSPSDPDIDHHATPASRSNEISVNIGINGRAGDHRRELPSTRPKAVRVSETKPCCSERAKPRQPEVWMSTVTHVRKLLS